MVAFSEESPQAKYLYAANLYGKVKPAPYHYYYDKWITNNWRVLTLPLVRHQASLGAGRNLLMEDWMKFGEDQHDNDESLWF